MSLCEYCGEKTGWFQSSHSACVATAISTAQVVQKLVFDETLAGRSYDELSIDLQKVLTNASVPFRHVRDAVLQGANDAASQIALKSPVSTTEFDRLVRIIRGLDGSLETHFSDEYASQMVQRQWFAAPRLQMSYVLWQVLNNLTPNFDETGEMVAFNLRSGEIPIYQTGNCVTYAEERTITHNSRTYQGLSLPVGGGIYYHIGGSQGHQERTSGLLPLDGGKILITTQSLYFGGQAKTFRIPIDRVLRYQPYVDGVGVCESHGAPKVFVFDYRGMDVGWFFYNLLSALSKPRSSGEESGVNQSTPRAKQSVIDLQRSFEAFRTANNTFSDLIKSAVISKGTLSTEDVAAYTTAVERLLSAAQTLEEQFEFASEIAKKGYHDALQSMRTSWATFASVEEGQINGDAYVPFLNFVGAFMDARNNYVLGV